ncbi:Gfo/Idh/MocA family oxidoreductase [Rhodoluna sp.]|uniref:Gfo/Idh/MocA family protein n=1 Tax=Rhodoluna sp. TaxID=1969481 RepID=UPI0025E4D406|nr:Gfo/Idh/MocA family oxidoreductase [Rhodoluna sp.]
MAIPVTKTVGVGLISVGWMGKVHSRAYQALPIVYPELGIKPRLIIAADTSQERADYARDVLGYERSTLDYTDVLNDPEVDVVSICAPNFLHAEIGIAAAKAGKAFWIEKPVGRGAEETESVESAAVEAGVVSTIGFNYRHAPAVEHIKKLVADGSLGQITNLRGTFFADYSSEPNGALSWRFIRGLAGSGVLGDLMGHLVDLVQYMVGPIAEVSGFTKTVYTERPVLQMGQGTHFDVIEGGERKPVENEDYAGMLIRLSDNAVAAGAIGTLEASRVSVGPRASYNFEIYGTEGSVKWDFERMNELEVAIGRKGNHLGYQRIMVGPGFGDFDHFHPGAGTGMGYDDLKVIEAKKFLLAYLGEEAKNSNIHDAVSAARVCSAVEESMQSKQWVPIAPSKNSTAAIRAERKN